MVLDPPALQAGQLRLKNIGYLVQELAFKATLGFKPILFSSQNALQRLELFSLESGAREWSDRVSCLLLKLEVGSVVRGS